MTEKSEDMDETSGWKAIAKQFQSQVKGQDPSDLKLKCLGLCQKYLAGNWSKINVEDLEVKRLTGGMMNMVYHCKIPINLRDNSTEPKEVVLRIYGVKRDFQTLQITENTLEENIKYVLLSEIGVGPQVYGVAKTGIIQKFYKHRHFTEEDLYDNCSLGEVAIKLARIHAMKPPIDKSRVNVKDLMVSSNKFFVQNFDTKRKVFEEYNCKTLLDCDLKAETDWVFNKIQSYDSPNVFSHNDFRFGNIMVTEEDGIVIGDYSETDYFYRGLDFASFFSGFVEIGQNSIQFKDESVVRYFIGKYLAESALINGKQYSDNKINTIEHIVNEMKVFTLFYSLFLSNTFMANEIFKFPIDDKSIMQMVSSEMEKYLALKRVLGDF